jgi:hypothetical protein
MDDLFSSDCAVDAGNGVLLHDGWVYSHLAGIGGRSFGDTVHQSASSRLDVSLMAVPYRLAFAAADRQQIERWNSPAAPGSSELSRIICLVPVLR